MDQNGMSDFKTSLKTEDGMKSTFVVKMSAPVGPKTADMDQTHTFTTELTETGKKYVNEIENKTLNFPYGDYFDIVERFEFEETGEGKCKFRFYTRQNWVKPMGFGSGMIQAAIAKYLLYKQGVFSKGLAAIINALKTG